MKILFVEQIEALQSKWVEPLRNKGWGVVRARSAEDATRMMEVHGEALEAIVVGERFVQWAEKQQLPYVVLVSTWNDTDIVRHQNSKLPAVAYLPFSQSVDGLYTLFEANATNVSTNVALKATGTDGMSAIHGLSLEDYSEVLTKPEPTVTGALGLQLEAPTVYLGGQEAKTEVQEIPIFEENPSEVRTRILDSTSIETSFNQEQSPLTGMHALDEDDLHSEVHAASLAPLPSPPPPPAPIYASPISQFSANPKPSATVSDVETLRSYLALREQDVAVFSGQLRSSQERVNQLEMILKMEKARNVELTHMVSKQEQKIKNYDQEKQVELEVMGRQVDDLEQQLKDRTEKTRVIETKLRLTLDEVNKVKERVRVDIRRIRVREKELEGQLEVLKKDSSALLQARDEKILELKRKIDLLEFNMELVQEQFSKEKQTASELKTKLKDAALVVKQVDGLLT